MIRVQYSSTHAFSSGVIRRASHSPFSHVDVLDSDDNCIGASDSPDAPVLDGNPRGVAVRPPNYEAFSIRRVVIIEAALDVERRFYDALYAQLGKPFDGAALYAFLSPDVSTERDWRAADAWFCSEMLTWCVEQSGLLSYAMLVSKNRVTPADSLLLLNPFVKNTDTFWQPVASYKLGVGEE